MNRTVSPQFNALLPVIKAVDGYLKYVVYTVGLSGLIFGWLALNGTGRVQEISIGLLALMLFAALFAVLWFAAYRPKALVPQSDASDEATAAYAAFRDQLVGTWVETVEPQVPTAVSLVQVRRDPATNGVRLDATGYGVDGGKVSQWNSEATCLNAPARKLFYYWKGHNHSNTALEAVGIAEITYEDNPKSIVYGSGMFSDTSFADMTGARKRIDFFKLAQKDLDAWENPDPAMRAEQVKRVLGRQRGLRKAQAEGGATEPAALDAG